VDRGAAEDWIRAHVEPVGAVETAHERPWSTVLRVPVRDGVVWFKACAPVQAFEPRLTAELSGRWPDRVPEVLAQDEGRAWLLLGDAGTPIRELGNPPETWLVALPLYAELQRGEAEHMHDHLAHGVPDLRVEDLVRGDLPLESDEIRQLREFVSRFADLCDELSALGLPETVQHDDLHMANVYSQGQRLLLLDWGDASISHPFASLVETFRFLEEFNGLSPTDPWFDRLATPIWSRGDALSPTCLRSRCASARSRTRSRGCGNATRCRWKRVPNSTRPSRSCCDVRLPIHATSAPCPAASMRGTSC
jgi:hypothetical protein